MMMAKNIKNGDKIKINNRKKIKSLQFIIFIIEFKYRVQKT